jgi:hypothetical protein
MDEEFRKKASKVKNLAEHFEKEEEWFKGFAYRSDALVDIVIDEENQVAAYIMEHHDWGEPRAGIEMIMQVYVYKEGRAQQIGEGNFRPARYTPPEAKALQWTKITGLKVEPDLVQVSVQPCWEEYKDRIVHLRLPLKQEPGGE